MITSFLKRSIALIAVPAILLSFTFIGAKTNFSGDWKLNEGKSDFGQRGARFATKELKVDQKDDAITITRTTPSFQGGEDMTNTETYTFDGKEVEGKGFGNSVRKSSLKWSGDESFTISSTTSMERNGESMEFHSSESWSLGDGGKTLTVTTTSTTPRGENTTKAVYDKQ